MPTRRELWDRIHAAASSRYEGHEARAITALLCEELFAMRFTDVIIEPNAPCPEGLGAQIERVVQELTDGRPVQYIVGYTEFGNLRLNVREGVLIPRPETEELVEWVASEADTLHEATHHVSKANEPLRILDIGTGSGCIAVSLAALLDDAEVVALDLSEEALQIAAENAHMNHTAVTFIQHDILSATLPEALPPHSFDLIVSNPPYVTQSERAQMQANVLNYEPQMALFVSDEDPLLFYRTIARHGRTLLRPGGALYFEINEQFGADTRRMLQQEGYSDVKIRRDIFEKERMVRAWLR